MELVFLGTFSRHSSKCSIQCFTGCVSMLDGLTRQIHLHLSVYKINTEVVMIYCKCYCSNYTRTHRMTCYHIVLPSVFALITTLTSASCLDGGLLFALRSMVEVVNGLYWITIFLGRDCRLGLQLSNAQCNRVLFSCQYIMVQ